MEAGMPEIKSVALPVSLSGRGLRVLYTAARYRPQAQATGFLLRECGRPEALSQHSLHLYGIRRPFGRQAVVDRGQAFPCVMPRAPALCVISVLEHVLHDLHARPCVCVLPSFFVCFLSCWEACGVRHGMRYLCAARGAGGPGFCRGTFGCSGEKARRGRTRSLFRICRKRVWKRARKSRRPFVRRRARLPQPCAGQ